MSASKTDLTTFTAQRDPIHTFTWFASFEAVGFEFDTVLITHESQM